jgi:L-threonylcarbamoyladenylate synthase
MTLPGEAEIAQAVGILRVGGLVAFPTETVYGLGADASNPDAVKRIFEAKGRPSTHPLIVHLGGAGELGRWAREIPAAARELAERFWPGPLTLVLKRAGRVIDAVTGGQDTVGLRVPAHPVAQALLQSFGDGIAAPSANRFGRVSATTAQHVREELADRVDLILDGGACAVGIESTILDLSTGAPVLLRPGRISTDELAAFLHAPVARGGGGSPRAPGGLAAHYAPQLPLRLVPGSTLDVSVREEAARGPVAVLARHPRPASSAAAVWMNAPLDAVNYAHHLYAALRQLDRSSCVAILVEAPPETLEWSAVRDRLTRAALGSGAADRAPASADVSDGT